MAEIDGLRLVAPASYAKEGYPHAEWARLRRESPVEFFEPPGWPSFWAITKHAEIVEISKQPDAFLNAPGMTMVRDLGQRGRCRAADQDDHQHGPAGAQEVPAGGESVLHAPRHPGARSAGARDRTQAGRRTRIPRASATSSPIVASLHPLKVIARILGVPESDEPFILKLTNELFGGEDPEFQRSEDRMEAMRSLFMEFWGYFGHKDHGGPAGRAPR